MARTDTLENFLTDVADAIREKKETEDQIPAVNFDTEIRSIPRQGEYQDKSLNIVANGQYSVIPDENYDAMTKVELNIDVAGEPLDPTTATPDDVLSPKTFYSNGQKLTGAIVTHKTPLGQTLDAFSSKIDVLSNYDTSINNQNIVCKYNDSGYLTFYSFDPITKMLTEIYTTTLSNVAFTISDCYYGASENDYEILIMVKDKSTDSSHEQIFEMYKLKVSTEEILFNKVEGVKIEVEHETGRLYSIVYNNIWYLILFELYYDPIGGMSNKVYTTIYSIEYNFEGNLNMKKKVGITNNTSYSDDVVSSMIETLSDGKHLLAITIRGNYGNRIAVRLIVLSEDFSSVLHNYTEDNFKLPQSETNTTPNVGGIMFRGGICVIDKYIVCLGVNDQTSVSNCIVAVYEYDSINDTISLVQTKTLPTSVFGGNINHPVICYKVGEYGISLFFNDSKCYGFTFKLTDGNFEIVQTLFEGDTEYAKYSYRNQNTDQVIFFKKYTLLINQEGSRLDTLRVNATELYNTDDSDCITNDVLSGKTFYNQQGKVIGTMPNNGELIYTPSKEEQLLPAGYISGGKVAGDDNFVSANIIAGVTIFGVEGAALTNMPSLTLRDITKENEENTVTVNIYDSSNKLIPMIGDNMFYISTDPIYIEIVVDGYAFEKKLYHITVDSYLDVYVPDFDGSLQDNYSKEEYALSGTLNHIKSTYSTLGTPSFATIKDYKTVLYIPGDGYVEYDFNTDLNSYEIQFDFYKANTASYSRGCYILGPNYEIEIKGSSDDIYWGNKDYDGGWKRDEWNTLKLVKNDTDEVQLYINDVLIATRTYADAITGLRFAQGSSSQNRFTGYFRNVTIKNLSIVTKSPEITISEIGTTLDITPTTEEQIIPVPDGVTQVKVSAAMNMDYYNQCDTLAKEILGG